MQYTKIKGIEKAASRLVYGTPGKCTSGNPEEAYPFYEKAWSYGFRIYDTANSYGKAEENMGYWIEKSGHREELILQTKGCNPGQNGSSDVFSGDLIRSQVTLSLQRLRTDYIDLYVLHRDDPTKPVDEIVEALNEMKVLGKIRQFGGSNWSMERLIQANEYAKRHGLQGFTVCSPCYSLAVFAHDPWGGSISISGEKNKAFRDWLEEKQMPVMAYSPQARGYLSGRFKTEDSRPVEEQLPWGPLAEYHVPENLERLKRAEAMAKEKGVSVSAVSLAWLLAQPLNLFPIIGSTGDAHIQEAISSLDLKLTDEECEYLLNGEKG